MLCPTGQGVARQMRRGVRGGPRAKWAALRPREAAAVAPWLRALCPGQGGLGGLTEAFFYFGTPAPSVLVEPPVHERRGQNIHQDDENSSPFQVIFHEILGDAIRAALHLVRLLPLPRGELHHP